MQTFVKNTKMSRDILRKAKGKKFDSAINHTKPGKQSTTGKPPPKVFHPTGSDASPIASMPKNAGISKATYHKHLRKPDLRDKSKLTFCAHCGKYLTSNSKELFNYC
jgi:hypothetical protein